MDKEEKIIKELAKLNSRLFIIMVMVSAIFGCLLTIATKL